MSNSEIHRKSLEALKKILAETSQEELEEMNKEISALNIKGPTIEEYLEMIDFENLESKIMKSKLEVNSVVELNENQLEIVITGINSLKNSYVCEIIEETFNIIKNGECERCPMNTSLEKGCVCYCQAK